MGKNNGYSWLNAVKKAFKSPTKDNEKKTNKRREEDEEDEEEEEDKKRGKRRWIFGKHFPIETTIIQHKIAKTAIRLCAGSSSGQEYLVSEQPIKTENDYSLSEQRRVIAAAEAAVVNAVEIIRRSKTSMLLKQDEAALVIQTIFRGYLARKALLALKGVVKMQALIRGHNVRKRADTTLQCIESLVRVQALFCNQRRRLSCDATMFGTSTKSTISNNPSKDLDFEEIEALIQKAKQWSFKQGKTLAHILSHETWTVDEDQNSDNNYHHPTVTRKYKNLHINHMDRPIDKPSFKSRNHDSYFVPASPETPISSAISSHRMSLSENSRPSPRPSYMSATQSAMARIRPHTTPRRRPSSPTRQQTGSARKRLSFPVLDEQRSYVPCYLTE